jgi:hypothetical protein
MCQMTGTAPSILLHPLDFLGAEDAPALRFFPGMDIPRERKLELVAETIDLMATRYELVTMREHASRLRNERLRKMTPDFAPAPTREAVSG